MSHTAETCKPGTPRGLLLSMAENLWQVKRDLNASDVHGVDSLAVSGHGTAYDHVERALREILIQLVDGSAERAEDVLFHLVDNYESVAYNLDREHDAHAAWVAEQERSRAVREKFDAMLADVLAEARNGDTWACKVIDALAPVDAA